MGFEPQDFAVTPKSLAAPVKRAVDKFQLLPEFLKVRGLVKQHIDSFNFFIEHDIKKIVKANNYFVSRQNSKIFIRYTGIRVLPPSYKFEFYKEDSRPHLCRLSDQTYAGDIEVKVVYNNGTYPQDKQMTTIIGKMPIMLRSRVCVLNGKDEAELAKLGECPLDPGGYFVVKGTEKVILIQEQLSKNRIIIDTDSKKRVTASVTCSTHEIKTKTVFFMDKDKIYLQLNQFIKPIPIIIVLRAMGMENDQEIVQMVGRDRQYFELLLPSIQDCASEKIYTQEQAMEYLEGKVGNPNAARPGIRKVFRELKFAQIYACDFFVLNNGICGGITNGLI